jgi:phage-related minor tail protein
MDFSTGAELNAIVKQEVALERVLEKYKEIGQAAQLTSELVTTGFQDMLTGTKSAEEVFANFLRNLAEMLIKTAQQMIAQYIAIGIARAFALGQSPAVGTRASDFNLTGFGNLESTGGNVFAGFTPRANGGPVSTGTPYMVGERGPELFVPSNSGTIVPNNALGGDVNVVVNVTETQTDTRGNGARANQVGNALAAAVQAEIIKQKRPGGLLAN